MCCGAFSVSAFAEEEDEITDLTEDDSSSGTTIIKAGTYRFNDELFRDSQITVDLAIPFTFTIANDGEAYTVVCSRITEASFDDSLRFTYLFEDIIPSIGGSLPQEIPVYRSGWEVGQIIAVARDTEVDDLNGAWFTTNTTMLIEAGTYRWNDNPHRVESDFSTIIINIKCEPIIAEGVNISEYQALFTYYDADIFRLGYIGTGVINHIPVPVYESSLSGESKKWNAAYLQYNFPPGYGQNITITEDTYVPTNFGLWAVENWEKLSEVEEPEAPPVTLGPVSSSDITPYLLALQEQISVSTTVEVLAVTTTGVVGLVFMWWGVRKVVQALMAAFKKGKISL